jgi:hypothetical protein
LAAHRLELVAVPVIRLADLSDAQARACRIDDNQLALAASWDEETLAAEIHALNSEAYDLGLLGFDDDDIERPLAPLDDDAVTIGDDVDDGDLDETPEPPRQPVSRSGNLWLTGEHRLVCRDASDPGVVARVMDGERAALLFTSPPYGLASICRSFVFRGVYG